MMHYILSLRFLIMERSTIGILSTITISLLLGWLIEPALVVIAGGILWIVILLAIGGAEDGNPIRTAIALYKGIPDRPLVRRALKRQQVAKERPPQTVLIWLLAASGAFLIATGLLWMHSLGQI